MAANGAKKTTTKKAETVETVVAASKETIENAVKAGAEAASKNFEQGFEQGFEMARERVEATVKGYDELAEFGRENFEAAVASSNAAAKAFETVNAEVVEFSKRSMEDSLAAVKALSAARTPQEFFEIQTDLVKSAIDNFVAESGKISDLVRKTSEESVAPIGERFTAAVERAGRLVV
jgi:phasin family protein